jgi:uncharacterized protein (TIGR02421 family)
VSARPASLSDAVFADIAERLEAGRPVRRSLPQWGRLHVDRALPFLVVYRRPGRRDAGTDRLALGSASHLRASWQPARREETERLVSLVARTGIEAFGAFLVVEVWAGPETDGDSLQQEVRVVRQPHGDVGETAVELRSALSGQRVQGRAISASIDQRRRVGPPGMRPLGKRLAEEVPGADVIGLEVAPFFRDPQTGDVYPVVLRQLARAVTVSLGRSFYRFTHTRTTASPSTYHALGRRSVVKAVFEIDHALAEVDEAFDLLLQVTPVNAAEAWNSFRRSRYEQAPAFVYRPLPFDPSRMKRRLWSVRTDRVEDPTLMYLFRDVQSAIDRRLTLLGDIGRRQFLEGSRQVHGTVGDALLDQAGALLDALPSRPRTRKGPRLDAQEFCALATEEVDAYRRAEPEFGSTPVVRDDIFAGLMVSYGNVYVGAQTSVPSARADALIQHEIGTHVVTRHNGQRQRLSLLAAGLAGYDELQEGLAVLAEFLVGGLDGDRMRVLAARVIAARAVQDQATFVDTFRLLSTRGFTKQSAFTIAMRVHRGGGLLKDAMYLRGLSSLLGHLARSDDFETLFAGKYALRHLPIVRELIERDVLSEPKVLPRYLDRPDARQRLQRVRRGMTPLDLVEG